MKKMFDFIVFWWEYIVVITKITIHVPQQADQTYETNAKMQLQSISCDSLLANLSDKLSYERSGQLNKHIRHKYNT